MCSGIFGSYRVRTRVRVRVTVSMCVRVRVCVCVCVCVVDHATRVSSWSVILNMRFRCNSVSNHDDDNDDDDRSSRSVHTNLATGRITASDPVGLKVSAKSRSVGNIAVFEACSSAVTCTDLLHILSRLITSN